MLSYRLGTVKDFHMEFEPVLSYSKPHIFSTYYEKKKTEKCIYSLSNQATEQNDSKVKRSKIKQKWVKQSEF